MAPIPVQEMHENGLYGGIGPHPSNVQVAKPFIFEQTIQRCLEANGSKEARETTNRLQAVQWIENVRRAMHLPSRTFMMAVVYYQRFRLAHVETEYINMDAAAAALFTACKIEDTLKKSKDILCAAYNLKVSLAEQLTPDDSTFEEPSKRLLGLERLMLESSGFDFRNRNPQDWVMKFTRLGHFDRNTIGKTAYRICLDLYKTYAPIKQTATTLALACVELAARLHETSIDRLTDLVGNAKTAEDKWGTGRPQVMETLLDLLELYTHSRNMTSVGLLHSMDTFIAIRITLNKESTASDLPRHTEWIDIPSTDLAATNGKTAANGTQQPTPVSPANPLTAPSTVRESPAQTDSAATASPGTGVKRPADRREITTRYMLDSERAREEQEIVASYFKEEWEEYEEVIERPARPAQSVAAALDREPDGGSSTADTGKQKDGGSAAGNGSSSSARKRSRERAGWKDSERWKERDDRGARGGAGSSRDRERDKERDKEWNGHKQRSTGRDERERDRDRDLGYRERERERERERDRDAGYRERESGRDERSHRDREREHLAGRDRERDRHREWDRDREREGEACSAWRAGLSSLTARMDRMPARVWRWPESLLNNAFGMGSISERCWAAWSLER